MSETITSEANASLADCRGDDRRKVRRFPFSRFREMWAEDATLRDECREADRRYRDALAAAERERSKAKAGAFERAAGRFYAARGAGR